MTSIQFAIVALIFFGLGDYVFKRAADSGGASHHFMMAQASFFCPTTLALAFFTDKLHWSPPMVWGGLAGFFSYLGLYNFSRSLARGAVSINAPLFRLNFIVTAALAIVVLGETVTPAKIVGMLAALVAAWLLLGAATRRPQVDGQRNLFALGQALFATINFGIASFCYKMGLVHGLSPFGVLAAQVSVFAPLSYLVVLMRDRGFSPPSGVWRYGLMAAAMLLVAFLSLLAGYEHGEASVIAPIAQMGFVVTAALGIFVLGEKVTARRIAGLTAALVALAAFAVG